MNSFGLPDAQYYCSRFVNLGGAALESVKQFESVLASRVILREGEQIFDEYRACSLREAERALLLSASHYRRSLDLMTSTGAAWAHVTLYYCAFHAAFALMAMFGCSVVNRMVVDVANRAAGSQALRIRKLSKKSAITTYSGSHRIFWDLFYTMASALRTRLEPRLAAVLRPVSLDPVWQIERRNELNYEYVKSLRLIVDFSRGFSADLFPASLPGVLGTQYAVSEGLLEVAVRFAREVQLETDALQDLKPGAHLREVIRKLVYHEKPPGLVRKTKKSLLI